jgi:hypothetical protein
VGTPNLLNRDLSTKAFPDIPEARHDDEPIHDGRDNKEIDTNFLLSISKISL